MIKNIIEDVSFLTNVSDTILDKLINVTNYSIGHAVHESLCEKEQFAILEIGIGELHIKVEQTGIRYKFIPDKALETIVTNTVKNKESPIVTKLDTALQSKIDKTYKELL